MSENAQFRQYIQNELEDRLNDKDFPDQGYDDDDKKSQRKKIAEITFAYENAVMIDLLNKRGAFIQTEKWDKADETVNQIQEKLADNELLNQLQTPCSVFVTF